MEKEELTIIEEGSEEFNALSTKDKANWFSYKIFGKKISDVKYLLVTGYIHKQLLEEGLTRTGLYQWINVFKGEIRLPRDVIDYNDYDIVHVNLSAQDVHLLGDIRERIGENSKTKLVVNNDYTTELWSKAFDYPTILERELRYADMIFGTEYYQATALNALVGRKVFVVPHPAEVKRLKSLIPIPQKKVISTIWRRYDNHYFIPSLAVRNHGLTTQLIGYDKNVDPKTHVATTIYDYVFKATNYMDFCDQLRESRIVYDPFTWHSFSRATIDTAAMGVAVVGTDRTQSMKICYPYTTVDPYDVKKARELIKKLNEDEEFRELVTTTAKNNVEFYNHENSLIRYLVSLKEALTEDRNTKRAYVPMEYVDMKDHRGEDVLKVIADEKTVETDSKEI